MSPSDVPSATVGHGTDADEERAWAGGAEPTGEPHTQDAAGAGRGVGLGLTTIIGILLIVVPLVWAGVYLAQAGAAGLGSGFSVLITIVLLACLAAGALLVRGLFRA